MTKPTKMSAAKIQTISKLLELIALYSDECDYLLRFELGRENSNIFINNRYNVNFGMIGTSLINIKIIVVLETSLFGMVLKIAKRGRRITNINFLKRVFSIFWREKLSETK